MSDISANLSLPYIQPSQAQKHVTHNEGMRRLDALVQLTVQAADETTPPAAATDGIRYIVPASATGAWVGQTGTIAVFEDTVWVFYPPSTGWTAWVITSAEQRIFDGSDWVPATDAMDFQNLDHIGIATTADATNRLAVSADATLLTHEGSGHQLKINKSGVSDSASLLFQTNWSARAEMGTTGSDDFEIKVSSDGSTFHTAMMADATTGRVNFPSGIEGLTLPEFGSGSLLTTGYADSKSGNMITNSTGFLGNGYNYPPEFTFDPTLSPNLPASFYFAGYYQAITSMTEMVPVDPNRIYQTESYIRQEGIAGDWSAFTNNERHLQYMGLAFFDADQTLIQARHHKRFKHSGTESLTTLAAPLSPGDTSISVDDASGWNEANTTHYNKGLIIFGYKNSLGRPYDYYSQFVEFDMFDLGQVNKTTHVITLNKALPSSMGNPDDVGGTWPIGTKIANSSSGDSFKYTYYDALHVPEVDRWYKTGSHIGGIDTSGTNYEFNFPPGTAYVRSLWFPNYSNRAGGYSGHPDTGSGHKIWNAGASIVLDPLAVQSEILTGANTGRKSIKVPDTDFSAGTISLIPVSRTVNSV